MSKFIEHGPCEACGSKDNKAIYDDHTFCFGCGVVAGSGHPNEHMRGLSDQALKRFGITKDGRLHYYPYTDPEGNVVAHKVRELASKQFRWDGSPSNIGLFGQNLYRQGGRAVTITEGELDAASIFDIMGDWPVVSIPNGAAAAVSACQRNYEWLNSFDSIVICFDSDEPGKKAAESVAGLFAIGKCRVVTLQKGKDANEYLMAGLRKEFKDEWWGAPKWTPEGLRTGSELWADFIADQTNANVSYPWAGLQATTLGIRETEVVLVTADTGVGKTLFLHHILHHVRRTSDWGVGAIFLEESNRDTATAQVSLGLDAPIHLPHVRERFDEPTLKSIFDRDVGRDGLIVWDHFGSNSVAEVINKVRHMAALGCRIVFIDHLSIIVSDQSGDERKQLDEISTKLKTLAMELKVALVCAIHTNRQGEIRSSAGPEKVASLILKLFREKESDDPIRRSILKGTISKNRFARFTGPAIWLKYVEETGRLLELTPDERIMFEKGEPLAREEVWV